MKSNRGQRMMSCLLLAVSLLLGVPSFAQTDSVELPSDTLPQLFVQNPSYDWISYQMKVSMETEDDKLAFQCFFVNRTDSLIYLNLHKSGIELARVVLTPDTVVYVNKLENEYYRGDYAFLGRVFGFPLDFQMMQALLNGRDFPHFESNLQVSEDEGRTILISPSRNSLSGSCTIMQQIDLNVMGMIQTNDITDLKSMRNVEINYDGWALKELEAQAEGKNQMTPPFAFFDKMKIELESEETELNIEIKNVKINQPGPTTIRIPDSFKEIKCSE